jgi:hypothetical protein
MKDLPLTFQRWRDTDWDCYRFGGPPHCVFNGGQIGFAAGVIGYGKRETEIRRSFQYAEHEF